MKGFVTNIEKDSLENDTFRTVLYTDERVQLVVMSLRPVEEIGEEVHELDQFLRGERGEGRAGLDGGEHPIRDVFAVVVPKGTRHNVINDSQEAPMKLYTLYAPPDHKDGTVHRTKADALASDPPFDGIVTEKS